MKKIVFITILLFSGVDGFCQLSHMDSIKQERRNEVDFIIKSLVDNNIDALRGLTKEEWDEGIREIYKKVDEANTRREYYFALRYFGALINDAHSAFPDNGVYSRKGIFRETDTIFPIWVKSWYDNSVFTVKDFSDNIPQYSEIISINDIPAKEIALKQRKIIPNESRLAIAATSISSSVSDEGDPRTGTSFVNYLFCENIKQPFIVEYKSCNDTILHKTILKGLPRGEVFQALKKDGNAQKEGFAMIFSLGKNTINYNKINDTIGVLKIKMFLASGVFRFLFAGTDAGFYKKLAKCMKQIKKDGITHLILDIRDNVGGYVYDVYELLACFTDEKFPITDIYKINDNNRQAAQKTLKGTYKYIYGKKNPDARRSIEIFNSLPVGSYFRSDTILPMHYTPRYSGEKYIGKTYLLTNGMCYSASILFADLFQSQKLGLLVGESPGGYTAVSNGDYINITLPLSKRIPLKVSEGVTGNSINLKYEYLKPDIPIEPTLEEWLYDRYDPLALLMAMIKESRVVKK
ncbi:MAG: hypothetical protein LBT48_01470 [Prevotellaceae bacterium]|jgi:hypothetical protein|nr:hypothetical protein [Prevotellaceae bacterium]